MASPFACTLATACAPKGVQEVDPSGWARLSCVFALGVSHCVPGHATEAHTRPTLSQPPKRVVALVACTYNHTRTRLLASEASHQSAQSALGSSPAPPAGKSLPSPGTATGWGRSSRQQPPCCRLGGWLRAGLREGCERETRRGDCLGCLHVSQARLQDAISSEQHKPFHVGCSRCRHRTFLMCMRHGTPPRLTHLWLAPRNVSQRGSRRGAPSCPECLARTRASSAPFG